MTTFSDTLANALRTKLHRLISNEPRLGERLEVCSIESVGRRLYELHFGRSKLATREDVLALLTEEATGVEGLRFSPRFLLTEWEQVVDAWQLDAWEAYRDVARLGRKTRLPEKQRAALWSIFEQGRTRLEARGLVTEAGMFSRLAAKLADSGRAPYDFAVIDEAQDVSVSQLRFLAAVGGDRANGLFFAGDLGQRIFQQPFSWKALGVEVRGRSSTLRINYRTSHQIRMQADRLLDREISDVDGNAEDRSQTVSTFNGPPPEIVVADTEDSEIEAAADWMKVRREEGVQPHEMGVFVRSDAQLNRARKAVEAAGLDYKMLDDRVETASGLVSVSTMHLAKGLEFRAVVVMACDDEVIPLQERIESAAEESEVEEIYNTERHLIYVACTRARDHLLLTSTEPASEFLDDLRGGQGQRHDA
jgi:superfamily I DNA/RNA helicase